MVITLEKNVRVFEISGCILSYPSCKGAAGAPCRGCSGSSSQFSSKRITAVQVGVLVTEEPSVSRCCAGRLSDHVCSCRKVFCELKSKTSA